MKLCTTFGNQSIQYAEEMDDGFIVQIALNMGELLTSKFARFRWQRRTENMEKIDNRNNFHVSNVIKCDPK